MKYRTGDRVLVDWTWEGTVVDQAANGQMVKVRFWWLFSSWYPSRILDLIRSAK
jgi:hypothetical protein